MTRVLVLAASLGLVASQALACDFMRSASTQVDDTKVASVTSDEQTKMSTPIVQPAPSTDEAAQTTVPAKTQ